MTLGYLLTNNDGSAINVVNLLSTVTGVNLKNTGQTTLYTVPTGKTLIITDVQVLITASSVFATPAIIRIGKAASYNEWLALTTLTSLSVVNNITSTASAAALAIRNTFTSGDAVKVDIQTGAGATTLTATFYTFGVIF